MGHYPEIKECVIFDLDGTLADVTHRRHHLLPSVKNWKAWNAAMHLDKPRMEIARLLRMIKGNGYRIVICSGREAVFRDVTETWLRTNTLHYDALYMRAEKDYRDDGIVKGELLDAILADGWKPWLVVEDRNRVVAMWRERGLTCLQCADGDF